jgi:hypothetical protein
LVRGRFRLGGFPSAKKETSFTPRALQTCRSVTTRPVALIEFEPADIATVDAHALSELGL